jgi:VCBS repeat-containing protein
VFHSTCDTRGDKVAGDFAQARSSAPFQAIGQIQTTNGSVTVTSASGAVVQANCGDFVCQHDTIETGADGNVGIIFNDGTAFNLSANARMVLNEFVYDPNGKSNSTLFSLSKGTFTFIPGKAAAASGLRIDTPVGRIRGTTREGGIGILTLAGLTFSVMDQIQAASQSPHGFLDDGAVTVGSQAASRSHGFLDDDRLTYKHLPHGGYEITMRDGRVIMHDDPGETIQIDPSGTVTRIPNSGSRMADLQNFQQAALSTLSQGPQGAAPGGSSTDTFNAPLDLLPINFTRPENRAVQNQVTVNIAPTTSGFVEVVQLQTPQTPQTPPTPLPELTADAGLHPLTEVLNTTGSTKLDIAPTATLTFTDLTLSALSASLASITWSGGATLPSGLSAVLADALSVAADTAGTSGSITATFGAPDKDFDFLAANETLTVVYTVTVTDTNGVSVAQPVTITITGSNDPPFLAADASNSHTVVQGLATTRTLTFTDVDLTDHHAVSTSVTSATWSGGATLPSGLAAVLTDALSTAMTDSTGSGSGSIALTFSAAETAFDFLAAGQTLTVIYNVTVTDEGGVSSTQPVTITIIGTNDTPVITSTAQTGAVTEHTNVDNSGNLSAGGIITFTDVDLTDKHTVTFTAGANNYLGTFTPTLTHDATGGSTGTVGWTFSVSDKSIEFLAAGQILTQTYTVQVADNNGGFTTQDVTITIHGTNEVPVIGGGCLWAADDHRTRGQDRRHC